LSGSARIHALPTLAAYPWRKNCPLRFLWQATGSNDRSRVHKRSFPLSKKITDTNHFVAVKHPLLQGYYRFFPLPFDKPEARQKFLFIMREVRLVFKR
jgi:hypothetical protein